MQPAFVSPDDWRATADLLAQAAIAESLDELTAGIMRPLKELFLADLAVWNTCGQSGDSTSGLADPNPIPPLDQSMARPPFTRRQNEAISPEFPGPRLCFGGQLSTESSWSLSMVRLADEYGPREHELARYLEPQLQRALARAAEREAIITPAESCRLFFAGAKAAYVLFDSEGRASYVSDAALEYFAQLPGGVGADKLPVNSGELREVLRNPPSWNPDAAQVFRVIQMSGSLTGALLWLPSAGAVLFLHATLCKDHGIAITRRENEILGWLEEGKSNAQIGRLLGVSPRTIEKHCGNLFAKLGVDSRFNAARSRANSAQHIG